MKKATMYFFVVLLLIYQNTMLLQSDLKTWIMSVFCVFGAISVYCISKGIKELTRRGSGWVKLSQEKKL